MASRIFTRCVLPCPVANDNKIEFQIAPAADTQRSAEACLGKFGVRELALAFTARGSPRPNSRAYRLLTLHGAPLIPNFPWPHRSLIANDNPASIVILPILRNRGSDQRESKDLSFRSFRLKPLPSTLLIANLELEFLASNTKSSPLRFSNRKKIAVFGPRRCGLLGESKAPSCPVTRFSLALTTTLAAEGSLITAFLMATFTNLSFRSTYCKHVPYRISNSNKNACFALPGSRVARHGSRATNRASRITSHAAFRSTIPRGQNAHH